MSDDAEVERKSPVIVITGTPGTGKSTTAAMLVEASPVSLKHINVGDLVKARGLHEGYDKEWQSYLVDDDKVLSTLYPPHPRSTLSKGYI
jgi:adenylate kinase